MNTRMFKNGFQSAMILVVVAILGLAGGTLIRDLMQASSGDSGKNVVVKTAPNDSVTDKQPVEQAQVNTEVPEAPEIPQFDVLRVEKDGGVLVAGRTRPNNVVEVMRSTGEVLGKVTAKRNGDFVVTLDKQLSRGEHILNLASTDEEGAKTVSVQSGVVFIPGTSGEVLALINQDGKASRVATMPESLKSKDNQVAVNDTDTNDSTSPTKLAPPRKVTAIEKYPLQVEAVEVEGENVFIAGAVAPAALVRIYINNVPVGSVRGTADHRFLLEKTFDLGEGEHVVRADVINEKTGGVWSRVVVDLKHEIPKELLNVAGGKGAGLKPTDDSDQANSTEISNGATGVEGTDAAKIEAPKGDETTVAETTVAETNAAETTDEETVAQVDKVKQQVVTETTTTVIKTAKVETVQPGAPSTNVAVTPKTSDTNANATKSNTTEPKPAESKTADPVVPKAVDTAMSKSAESAVENTAETAMPKEVETAAAETIEVTKIQTGRSIIIKWGDSLWRISRRTYGRGIRYTTIYNANRSQISDPNKIYVGQVFKLPENADL